MELTKRNFTVLYEYLKNPYASQREVAERTGLSLGSVNAANKELTNEGLLESDSLTDNGYEALHPYKVENAVILAAGLSSRFAPISYEKPKGLLKVRGEILIERQIRQLQDAGISNSISSISKASSAFRLSSTTNMHPKITTHRLCA